MQRTDLHGYERAGVASVSAGGCLKESR